MSIQPGPPFELSTYAKQRIDAAVYGVASRIPVEPDKAVLANHPVDEKHWKCSINQGVHLAAAVINSTIQHNHASLGGPALALYLPNLLLSTSITAVLIKDYIDAIADGAGLKSSFDSISAPRSQFFFYYLGVLFNHNRPRGFDTAERIFSPLVKIAILMNDKVNRETTSEATFGARQREEASIAIHAYHDELLEACQSQPQPRLVAPPSESLFVYLDTVGREPTVDSTDTEPADPTAGGGSITAAAPAFATLSSTTSSLAIADELAAIDAADDLEGDELDLVASLLTTPPFTAVDHDALALAGDVDIRDLETVAALISVSSTAIGAEIVAGGPAEGTELEGLDIASTVAASSSLSLSAQAPGASSAMKRKTRAGKMNEDLKEDRVDEVPRKRARKVAGGAAL